MGVIKFPNMSFFYPFPYSKPNFHFPIFSYLGRLLSDLLVRAVKAALLMERLSVKHFPSNII